ncbi:heavy metal translocating P-type ATPase [Jannaschia rubra]|uniref:heavy metal translocating P-type ATPase n=1 Tax=Jannaschia rubra TaxID=282197 RepID=UPI002490541E|nr:heavy metal translocating P-type ATPase [Jannaschia rubra]
MATQTFEIEGLSCASCVGRAERALSAVPGTSGVRVNLATHRAHVDGTASARDLSAALAEAGYPARQETVVLDVDGMTCASCVGRVERALMAVPGVTGAQANFGTGRATVTVLHGSAKPADLARASTQAGYAASVPQAGTDARPEHDDGAGDLRRRLIVAAALTLPVFVVEMGGHFIPGVRNLVDATIGRTASWWIQFVLATLVLAGPGRVFFTKGIRALLRGAPEMNSLVALGTFAAWGYSTVALLLPGIFPEGTRAVYFEAAAVIVTLILLGRWLEARARGRTGAAIARLVGLRPATARVIRDGAAVEVPVADIVTGDLIEVRPGARLAVDGTVTDGASWIDESMVTGEPDDVRKEVGDPVTGGTVNGAGAFTMRADAVGEDTVLAQIIRMVETAQGAKLPIQALVDRVTGVFVPVVMGLAALTVAVWLFVDPSLALVAGVSVLIIACPCAMGLATPTSIMVGTGRAAELGVLFRRGDALQALQGVRVVALDKTGTLTAGRPEVTALILAPGLTRPEVLALTAAVEAKSEHPIAGAILRAAEREGLTLPEISTFESHTGLGVSAMVNNRRVLVGAERFLTGEGVDVAPLRADADRIARDGRTPLWVAIDGAVAAAIGVDDPIKPSTPAAIRALHDLDLQVAMITGDAATTARAVAGRLGIDHVVAEVMPVGKVDALKALRADHGAIAFVGDGINDAPALAEADVGIAIGTGTDIAIEAADVVLMSGELDAVVRALSISRATMRNIRQNLFWAFAYNAALIPVAAGVLYGLTGTLLSPMLAAGAMALSSVFVLSNALRLRRAGTPVGDASPDTRPEEALA